MADEWAFRPVSKAAAPFARRIDSIVEISYNSKDVFVMHEADAYKKTPKTRTRQPAITEQLLASLLLHN